tara:strand:+ start:11454 stop:13064 length:1611 start_codon:yes stop_codon:yes gene_type:complete
MKINKVEIEGFLSIKDQTINFDDFKGLVNVVGLNKDTKPHSSNGAGKSSIIEAVVFALFGKTIRKTTEKSITHSVSRSKCKVTLTVNDNVVITRTKKPPSLILEIDGEPYTKEGILQTQEYLEKTLNTNYNVFLASMVFGQQNSINFLSSSAEEKRSIIQSFLDVSDLFKYRSKIRSMKSQLNNGRKVATALQGDALQKVNATKQKIEKLTSTKKKAIKTLTPEKASLLKKHSLAEIQDIETQRTALELDHRSLSESLTFCGRKIDSFKDTILKFSTKGLCDHCGKQPKTIAESLVESEDLLVKEYENRQLLKKEVQRLSKKIDSMPIPIPSEEFEFFEKLKNIDVELKVLKNQLSTAKRLATKYSKEMVQAQKEYDLMRFWELAFSEQGLVKYIIRHILEYFNEMSNYYLATLTRNTFTISFDEVLEETIKTEGRKVFYDTLSGGEKKKVSLAVMMALNDLLVLSGKERSNIVFFDEVADSLDREGVKGLCDLMQELVVKKKLFIISHNDYLTSLIEHDATELQVIKRGGITTFK